MSRSKKMFHIRMDLKGMPRSNLGCAYQSNKEIEPVEDPKLVTIAKHINDLDDLVQALRRGAPRVQTWQRLLVDQLNDIDRLVQILRMSVAMARPDEELREAAFSLYGSCREVTSAMAGTRADATSRMALKVARSLANEIHMAMECNSPRKAKLP
jgi:phage shock protein A